MKIHELKIWAKFFEEVLSRLKTYEVRLDDRGFRNGDQLRLMEWSPLKGYSGRECLVQVSSLMHVKYLPDMYFGTPDYVVMSIRIISRKTRVKKPLNKEPVNA